MKAILTILIAAITLSLTAQDVEFAYDNAGNRVTRRIINTPAPPPPENNEEDEMLAPLWVFGTRP